MKVSIFTLGCKVNQHETAALEREPEVIPEASVRPERERRAAPAVNSLAEKLDVSRQAISHWENGDSLPNYEMLVRLMDVLHMTADELLPARE